MKSLMDVCRNWGTEGCHPDISKWKSIAEIEEGEENITRPAKEELNNVCRNCKALSFKECPNCGSTDIMQSMGVEIKGEGKKIADFFIDCNNCGNRSTVTKLI